MESQGEADVHAASAGDSAAFGRLYDRHVGRIRKVAQWTLGTSNVDDVVQEAFFRAWRKLHLFNGSATFSTWLNRLATNVFLRARKRSSRSRSSLVPLGEVASPPLSVVRRPDQKVDLERAVEDLPARARLVFVLHDVQGFLHREIAAQLGISVPASRSQLSRARLLLRRSFETEEEPS